MKINIVAGNRRRNKTMKRWKIRTLNNKLSFFSWNISKFNNFEKNLMIKNCMLFFSFDTIYLLFILQMSPILEDERLRLV